MMKKNFLAFAIGNFVLASIVSTITFAHTTKHIVSKPKIPNAHFTLHNNDCYTTPAECLLTITPSKWIQDKDRTYDIEKICDYNEISLLYNHTLLLKDQVAERKFLGQKICKGVVTISDMSLPFAKFNPNPHSHPVTDPNDGTLLLDTVRNNMQDIQSLLGQMQTLATQVSSGTLDPEDLVNIDITFMELLSEVSRVANVTSFNGISLLNGSTNSIQIPTHKNKYADFISVPLPDLTPEPGLNINTLDLLSVDHAQAAIPVILSATHKVESEIRNIDFWRSRISEVAQRDATITTIDLNGPQFVIQQESAALKHSG